MLHNNHERFALWIIPHHQLLPREYHHPGNGKRASRHCLASDLGRASQTAGLRDGSRVKATQRFHRKGEEDEALTLASISSVSHLPLACLCQRSTCLGFSTSNVGAGQRAGDSHVNCSILSIRPASYHYIPWSGNSARKQMPLFPDRPQIMIIDDAVSKITSRSIL